MTRRTTTKSIFAQSANIKRPGSSPTCKIEYRGGMWCSWEIPGSSVLSLSGLLTIGHNHSQNTDAPPWPSRADRCATAWMIRFGIDFWPLLGFINSLLRLPVCTVETLFEASINPKQTLGTRSVWLDITINNSNWPIRRSPRI